MLSWLTWVAWLATPLVNVIVSEVPTFTVAPVLLVTVGTVPLIVGGPADVNVFSPGCLVAGVAGRGVGVGVLGGDGQVVGGTRGRRRRGGLQREVRGGGGADGDREAGAVVDRAVADDDRHRLRLVQRHVELADLGRLVGDTVRERDRLGGADVDDRAGLARDRGDVAVDRRRPRERQRLVAGVAGRGVGVGVLRRD